jgi:hypothetical protein
MPPLNSKLITCNQTTLLYNLKSKKCIATNIWPVKKKAKVNNLNHPFFSIAREYIYKKKQTKKNPNTTKNTQKNLNTTKKKQSNKNP